MWPIFQSPFEDLDINLDLSGLLGFFGGEEGIAVVDNILLVPDRRWMGWYNSPGNNSVAHKYGKIPKSTFWDTLFPGDPSKLEEVKDKKGPKFVGVYSGIQRSETEQLAYLLCLHCDNMSLDDEDFHPKAAVISPMQEELELGSNGDSNLGDGHTITIVDFPDVDIDGRCQEIPANSFTIRAVLAFTVLFSFTCGAFCILFGDFPSALTIFYGMFSNGSMSLVLGAGHLLVNARKVPNSFPLGDGIFFDSNRSNIIVVRGREHTIATIRTSKFQAKYPKDPKHSKIGTLAVIILLQSGLQLWLIPQGLIIGQLFFLASLAVSYGCNGYIISQNFEKIQTGILLNMAPCSTYKFPVKSYSTAVALIMGYFHMSKPEGLLDGLFPNNLPLWSLWKDCICQAIKDKCNPSETITPPAIVDSEGVHDDPLRSSTRQPQARDRLAAQFNEMSVQEQEIVRDLLQIADAAFEDVVNDKRRQEEFIKAFNLTRKDAQLNPQQEV